MLDGGFALDEPTLRSSLVTLAKQRLGRADDDDDAAAEDGETERGAIPKLRLAVPREHGARLMLVADPTSTLAPDECVGAATVTRGGFTTRRLLVLLCVLARRGGCARGSRCVIFVARLVPAGASWGSARRARSRALTSS